MFKIGIPIAEISEKVSSIKIIIGDVSDCIILDYLKQCDLNIENAINFHFSRSLSPTPTDSANALSALPNNQTGSNSVDDSNNNSDSRNVNNSPSPMEVDEDNDVDNKSDDTKKRRSKRAASKSVSYKYKSFKLSDEEDEQTESEHDVDYDSDDYDPAIEQNKNKNRNPKRRTIKKRKRSQSDDHTMSEPQTKKRKIDTNISTNTDSSMKEEQNDDNKNANNGIIPSLPPNHSKWSRYTLGTIKLRYNVKPQTHLNSLGDLWWQLNSNVVMEYRQMYEQNEHWFKDRDSFELFMLNLFKNEMRIHDRVSNIRMEIKNTKLIKIADDVKKNDAIDDMFFPYIPMDDIFLDANNAVQTGEPKEKIDKDSKDGDEDLAKELDVLLDGMDEEEELMRKQKEQKDKMQAKVKKDTKEKEKAEVVMPFAKSNDDNNPSYTPLWSFDFDEFTELKYTTPGLYESDLLI